jgi:glycosyltransferase involved in cell wall biosynthesis
MERIIVLGRDMRALVARKMGGVCHSIIIIPNWADVNEITPLPRSQNGLLQELGLAQKFIIQYSGNMGRTHGVESLLACAHQLSHQPDVHFLFIGAGAKKNWLDKTVQRDDLRNVTVLPTRPRNDLASSLNACDVAIISFMAGTAGISVPSRMYNILAAGKPIVAVADDDSELALVVREAQIGWVVPPGQTDRIVEAILEARANQKRLIEMGWRARAVAEQNYSFERIIQAYCDLIRSLDHESQS